MSKGAAVGHIHDSGTGMRGKHWGESWEDRRKATLRLPKFLLSRDCFPVDPMESTEPPSPPFLVAVVQWGHNAFFYFLIFILLKQVA